MLKSRWASFWVWYLPLAILLVIGVALARGWRIEQIRQAVGLVQESVVEEQVRLIGHKLDYAIIDVLDFGAQSELADYLATGSRAPLDALAREYQAMMRASDLYDQVRLLDASGREVLRVDFDGGRPRIVPETELQDKGARYYVRSAMALDAGQIYLSPMDLNVEHEQLERPYKPMLQIATPVVDAHGIKRGLVVLSYRAEPLLSRLRDLDRVSGAQTMLVNCEGYWLLAPDPEMAWGFQVPGREHQRLQGRYPEIWQALSTQARGWVRTGQGAFYFRRMTVLDGPRPIHTEPCPRLTAARDPAMQWIVLSFLDESRVAQLTAGFDAVALTAGVVILALLAVSVRGLTVLASVRREQRRRLEQMARTDPLTGLANRLAFHERVELEIQRAHRHQRRLAVAILDLDGFKAINDTQGHPVGDRVLRDVAAVLTRGVRARSDDLAGRLGGDEFALLLGGAGDRETVRDILDKLRAGIAAADWQGQRVSASIGAALYPDDGERCPDLLAQADAAMYVSKRAGKNRITFAAKDSVS